MHRSIGIRYDLLNTTPSSITYWFMWGIKSSTRLQLLSPRLTTASSRLTTVDIVTAAGWIRGRRQCHGRRLMSGDSDKRLSGGGDPSAHPVFKTSPGRRKTQSREGRTGVQKDRTVLRPVDMRKRQGDKRGERRGVEDDIQKKMTGMKETREEQEEGRKDLESKTSMDWRETKTGREGHRPRRSETCRSYGDGVRLMREDIQ
ncbi:hypothetical protein Tco_0025850 [Tanacetum coccineum]